MRASAVSSSSMGGDVSFSRGGTELLSAGTGATTVGSAATTGTTLVLPSGVGCLEDWSDTPCELPVVSCFSRGVAS